MEDQERRTDPETFEDTEFPEIDHDAERKAEIESEITEKLIEALEDMSGGLDKEPWS